MPTTKSPGTENLRASQKIMASGAPDATRSSGEPARGTANLAAQEHLETSSWRGPNTESTPAPSGVHTFTDGRV